MLRNFVAYVRRLVLPFSPFRGRLPTSFFLRRSQYNAAQKAVEGGDLTYARIRDETGDLTYALSQMKFEVSRTIETTRAHGERVANFVFGSRIVRSLPRKARRSLSRSSTRCTTTSRSNSVSCRSRRAEEGRRVLGFRRIHTYISLYSAFFSFFHDFLE